ncbi:hypothetical protein H9P43_005252 [Blastocladiella emersonii ATCC 22665]|nr:hypothetical protein H9P43_005241 [Blastocladiella emersonii ATCC 22665]KAI9179920.1 hypothetical protein H9P43_005252 [Blastocladiella emersonii ATCC 22665]
MSLLAKLSMVSSSFPTGTRARKNVFSSPTRTAPMAAHVLSKDSAAASDAVAPTRPVSAGHPAMATSTETRPQPLPFAHVGNLADSGIVASTPSASTERIHCASASSGPKAAAAKAGARAHAAAAAVRHAAQSASCAVRRAALTVPAAGTIAAARFRNLCSRRSSHQQQQPAAPLTGVAATLDSMARKGDPLACPGELGSAVYLPRDGEKPSWQYETHVHLERHIPGLLVDHLRPEVGEFRCRQSLNGITVKHIAHLIRTENRELGNYVALRLDAKNDATLPREVPRETLTPSMRSAIKKLDGMITGFFRHDPIKPHIAIFYTQQHAADFKDYVRYMGRVHDSLVRLEGSGGQGFTARALAALAVQHLAGVDVHDSKHNDWEKPAVMSNREVDELNRDSLVVMYYLIALSRNGF